MDKDEIVQRAVAGVRRAAGYCDDVEFSPEDAARTEPDFLCRVVEAAIEAGATTVNIPDTVGYATPNHFSSVIQNLVERVPNIDRAVISVHCHNDLGLAVANSLAAVENGAGQIECTINGIGERAGNTALEEVAIAMSLHPDQYSAPDTLDLSRLFETCQLVSELTGIPLPVNKPVCGRTVFATEAGIHQDGLLKHPDMYLPFRPALVGGRNVELVLGRHSGRNAVAHQLQSIGIELTESQTVEVLARIKRLAKGTIVDDACLQSLAEETVGGACDGSTHSGSTEHVIASRTS
jgi:2-isopropylmalate synthase